MFLQISCMYLCCLEVLGAVTCHQRKENFVHLVSSMHDQRCWPHQYSKQHAPRQNGVANEEIKNPEVYSAT